MRRLGVVKLVLLGMLLVIFVARCGADAQEARDPATQPLLQMLSSAQYGLASCIGASQALQAQLAAANKQIDDLKKAAAAKDEPKGQN